MPRDKRRQTSFSSRMDVLARARRKKRSLEKKKRRRQKEAIAGLPFLARAGRKLKEILAIAAGGALGISLLLVLSIVFMVERRAWEEFRSDAFEGQTRVKDTIFVYSDPGGNGIDRLAHVKWIKRNDLEVRVSGLCASACTMYLDLPKVCATPDSIWMFHRARIYPETPIDQIIGIPSIWVFDHFMMWTYPPIFRTWIAESQSKMSLEDKLWIAGHDLIEAGWIEACDRVDTKETMRFIEEMRDMARTLTADFRPPRIMPKRVP